MQLYYLMSSLCIPNYQLRRFIRFIFLKKSKNTNEEIKYLDRQIRRADLEIEILEHKLEVGSWSQVNYVNYWIIN